MKYGLLVYSSKYPLCNLGDYVQSIAARQFLGDVDANVCRESLDDYSGEELRLILNGWFTHEPSHWPPSRFIHPLFISFHINSVARDGLTGERSIAYLKKWSPIGCRDRGTVELLQGHGVEAYFSGCLTLTLGRTWKRGSADGGVVFVDPHYEFRKDAFSLAGYARILMENSRTVSRVASRMFGQRVNGASLLRASALYGCYRGLFSDEALAEATYYRQEVANEELGDDASKFAHAEALLTRYAAASFVVTSRIHCALPCLGIGTPVLYVEDQRQAETSSCRLNGLRELLHVVKSENGTLRSELVDGKITPTFSFRNKEDYRVLAESLTKTCEAFTRAS